MAHGDLTIGPRWRDLLHAQGVRTVQDLLARAEWVRDLPDRANLRLALQGLLVHVKLRKPRRRDRLPGSPGPANREQDGLGLAERLGVPVPALVLAGQDPRRGAVTGTLDLAPALPLDDALRAGLLDACGRRRVRSDLARAVARLHASGVHHRDLYLNHVYVDPSDGRLAGVIDWDRHGHHGRPRSRRVVKDLAALEASIPPGTVGEGERRRFLLAYLRASALDARRIGARLARRIARRAERIRAHVPRTPVGEAARARGSTA